MSDLRAAIAAIKAGSKPEAQQILKTILQAEPKNVQAWLLMTKTGLNADQRIKCLERVLTIEPDNQVAKDGLAKIKATITKQQESDNRDSEQSVVENPRGGLLKETPLTAQPEVKSELPPEPETKQCPYCAETIKSDAVVCRFCNRDLESGELPSQQPPAPQVVIQQTEKKRNWFVTILALFGLLAILCVCTIAIVPGFSRNLNTRSSNDTGDEIQPSEPQPPEYLLELLSFDDEKTSDRYFKVHGQVKNISQQSLDSVVAVVQMYDNSDGFVKSDSALIEFIPILPGQTSPFEVTIRNNPEITSYSVTFKYLLGGTIPTKNSSK